MMIHRFFYYHFLVVMMMMTVILTTTTTNSQETSPTYPTSITLRGGVLVAPPFATDDGINGTRGIMNSDTWKSTSIFGGFQSDLLNRLQTFAMAMDNVKLNVELDYSIQNYGQALDLIANDCKQTDTAITLAAEVAETQLLESIGSGETNTQINNTQILDSICDNNRETNGNGFDFVLGDYYVNPDRSVRVDFTPSWLRTTMSTMKYIEKSPDSKDYTTLTEASNAAISGDLSSTAPICLVDGTYLMTVVQSKFPLANYYMCNDQNDCIIQLKAENCVLYVDDELQLRYRAALDSSLEVTGEQFNTQYLVWPMSYAVPELHRSLLKRWIYAAVSNATMDLLYFKYFQKELCPIGTAGSNCELPCDPIHGQANANGKCVCISTKWTGDDCTIEVLENYNYISSHLKVIGRIMFSVNIALVVLCLCWLIYQRSTPQIRVSQPYFLGLVLLGCFISSTTIIVLGIEDDDNNNVGSSIESITTTKSNADRACMALPWFYSVGFSITFGTLFAKIRRVYLIFTKAAGLTQRSTNVTWQETIAITLSVLLIDIVILTIWTIMQPLTFKRDILIADKFDDPLESYGYCDSADSNKWIPYGISIALLHLVLLCIASYMCYCARAIPSEFSESKYITMAMISNLQILVIGLPVLVLIGGKDPSTTYFVRSSIIWMNDLVVVCLIFGNLVHSVHFSSRRHDYKKNDDDGGENGGGNGGSAIKSMVSTAVKKYSEYHRGGGAMNPLGSGGSGSGSGSSGAKVSSNGARGSLFSGDFNDNSLEEEQQEQPPTKRGKKKNPLKVKPEKYRTASGAEFQSELEEIDEVESEDVSDSVDNSRRSEGGGKGIVSATTATNKDPQATAASNVAAAAAAVTRIGLSPLSQALSEMEMIDDDNDLDVGSLGDTDDDDDVGDYDDDHPHDIESRPASLPRIEHIVSGEIVSSSSPKAVAAAKAAAAATATAAAAAVQPPVAASIGLLGDIKTNAPPPPPQAPKVESIFNTDVDAVPDSDHFTVPVQQETAPPQPPSLTPEVSSRGKTGRTPTRGGGGRADRVAQARANALSTSGHGDSSNGGGRGGGGYPAALANRISHASQVSSSDNTDTSSEYNMTPGEALRNKIASGEVRPKSGNQAWW